MEKITHISVRPGDDADPEDPPKAVYVEAPEADALDEEPFASGRHRIERTPQGDDDKPPSTLWSWTEGSG
jgi:hypothetical protein